MPSSSTTPAMSTAAEARLRPIIQQPAARPSRCGATSPTKPTSSTSSPPPTGSARSPASSTMPASSAAPRRVDEMDAARINRMLAVNVTGSFLCAKAAIRRMSTRHGGKGGAIVNLASAAAKLGVARQSMSTTRPPRAPSTPSPSASRSRSRARASASTPVRPGIIDTEIHASGGDPDRAARMAPTLPMPRAGTADEVAAAPSSGCCRTKPPTPPAPPSPSPAAAPSCRDPPRPVAGRSGLHYRSRAGAATAGRPDVAWISPGSNSSS